MERHKRNRPAQAGWSLMEAIMAMSIGFILLVGTAEMLVLALRLQDRARSVMETTDLARARLEALRADTTTASSPSPPALTGGETTASGRNGRAYSIAWTKASGTPPLVLAKVRVFPTGRPERSLIVPLFLHPLLGF
jgi:type II secretory pathway component PulJ